MGRPLASAVALSPQSSGLWSKSWSFMATSRPSSVVNLPPSVPAPTCADEKQNKRRT